VEREARIKKSDKNYQQAIAYPVYVTIIRPEDLILANSVEKSQRQTASAF
jgi:hypothetical protein